MVKVQVELSEKSALAVRLVKAKGRLTNVQAINKILESLGDEYP